jgi:hypothetical protein
MKESVFFVLIYSVVSIRNSCTLVRLLLVFFSSFFPSSLLLFVWGVRIYKSKKYEGETSSEKMVAPAASLIDDIAAANMLQQYIDVDDEIIEDGEEEAGEDDENDDDDINRAGAFSFQSPPLLRRTNSEYINNNNNQHHHQHHRHHHHHHQPSFLSHFISSLPSTVLEEKGGEDEEEKEMLNNTNPVLRRSVTAPVNACNVAAAEDAMMQHTREYNGVFRPAFVTRWSSFVDIGVNKRYELGTWTTKESAARAHDAALLFMRGDSKETREMMNFPMSEYENTLKELKDMNISATSTNEDFVEALVESSAKIERRQSRYRGVVKSKEHENKFEARIFYDEM